MTAIAALDSADARALTDQIKQGMSDVWELVAIAFQQRAWSALGYDSWDDYLTQEFIESQLQLPREKRREKVASLREAGLTLRAIAAATGVSEPTISRDLSRDSSTPENESPDGEVDEDVLADQLINGQPTITGLDGKTYPLSKPKPKPEPPPRPILTLLTHEGEKVLYPQPQSKPSFNQSPGAGISWAEWSWNPVTGCLHGCEYCLAPETPVLMADMTWKPISEIKSGDTVVGFDEESPRGQERRWRAAEVTDTWRTQKVAHRIVFDDGREIVASAEHKWICDRNTWRRTAELRPGHRVRTIFGSDENPHPWYDEDGEIFYQQGYIAGMTLGDGTFRFDPSWRSDKLGFPQMYWRVAVLESDWAILDRLQEYLRPFGEIPIRPFPHYGKLRGSKPMAKIETRKRDLLKEIDDCFYAGNGSEVVGYGKQYDAGWLAGLFDAEGGTSGGSLRISQKDITVLEDVRYRAERLGFTFIVEKHENACPTVRLIGDCIERARFLAVIQPALTRKGPGIEGRKVRTDRATVIEIIPSIEIEMVDITTSTGTFVADGLLTHNCYAREIATSSRAEASYPVGFTPLFHSERLDAPKHTTIPKQYRDESHLFCMDGNCKICAYRRVFVCSMADLYGQWVPKEWIQQVHAAMVASPQWQYITLTKFPDRYARLAMPAGAWVGTSVDEQRRVRIAQRAFAKLPPGQRDGGDIVKWLSLEPLREPLEFDDFSMFDWVVIGAQTQTRQPSGVVPAFPPPIGWVNHIIEAAKDAGCAVHCKPNLHRDPGMQLPNEYPTAINGMPVKESLFLEPR